MLGLVRGLLRRGAGRALSQTHTAASGLYKGFAGSLYVSFPTSAWQGQAFERIPAGSAAKKGDVAIWGKEPAHPDTHVAIVTQDAPAGARITVIAQNVGHTQDARIMSETPHRSATCVRKTSSR